MTGGADAAQSAGIEVFQNGILKAGLYLDTTYGVKCYNESWGNSGGRYWHKYQDGTIHIWGYGNGTANINSAYGSMYQGRDYFVLPHSIGTLISINVHATSTGNVQAVSWSMKYGSNSSISGNLVSPVSLTNFNYILFFDIWGTV